MTANLGSMSRNFADKSKERLLSRKGYSELGLFSESYTNINNEDVSFLGRIKKWWSNLRLFLVNAYEMGRSDPRQFIFAAKSGLALAIVSVLIFFKEPLNYISQYSIWAILTVIVVFEFSIGATLSKGFNRALGTFSAVLVSGTSHFVQTAVSRLLLIGVGAGVCLIVNICVYPIWAGEDLHKLVDVLIVTFGMSNTKEYLQRFLYIRLQMILYTLGFAVWEPPHGRYKMLRYPWSHYVKVSGALRHCAFMVMAMHGCILAEIQAAAELRNMFKNEIQKVGTEGAKVLRELGRKVEKMERLSPDVDLLEKVHEAAEELQMMIDQKSYHLVNSEKWAAAGKQLKEFEDADRLQELKEDEIKPNVINSLSEANLKPPLPFKNLNMSTHPSMVHWGSSEDVLKQQTHWPSRLSILGDTILNEREVRTHESASALSLATFTSLLIEFVARLQNLLSSFEELSEKAKFSEPVNPLEAKEEVGIWTRLLKCIGIKD
ncbi:Aluminum-activated malate transporter [Cynara cardunculus var. scolymus]|uniref:Aluminum-activated malate transporter n=1 Tax=Cynara cardunculus var. scolymus TaxID=59895 RepID=A0A103YEH7_CYNCS|nr:Aluminum-activated malate transporter [Cynara cardunculus var. scolymus]